MGMTTRAAIAAAVVEGGRAPDTPVAVIEAGRRRPSGYARLGRPVADVDLGPPAVIVVAACRRAGGARRARERPRRAGRSHGGGDTLGERAAGLVAALERAGATAIDYP